MGTRWAQVVLVGALAGALGCGQSFMLGTGGSGSSTASTSAGGASSASSTSASSTSASSTSASSASASSSGGTCPKGQTSCQGSCVDLLTTAADCGKCGNACPSGDKCILGQCHCPSGGLDCAGTCVDELNDHDNCGGCGHQCEQGGVCTLAICKCAGNLQCSGSPEVCTQTKGMGDPKNCGSCGHKCEDAEWCIDGACTCKPPLVSCSGTCVDPTSDPMNCGGCGMLCPTGTACMATAAFMMGACVPNTTGTGCPSGYTLCGPGSCVQNSEFAGNPIHCGNCTTMCAEDEVCTLAGKCEHFIASPSCTTCPCTACGDYACCHMAGYPVCVDGSTCGL